MNNNETINPQDSAAADEQHKESSVTEEQSQLATCKQELQLWKDRYVHTLADFENFKKRFARERLQLFEDTKIQVLKGLLPIADDIDRALEEYKKNETAAELSSWVEGFVMIQKALQKLLQEQGLQEIAEGTDFDPELYEAVMTIASGQHASGSIVQVLQKGYKIGNRVIRPAKVSIAQ